MGHYIAATVIKKMVQRGIDTANSRILVMGLTFKENCPDLRNTKVTDIISEFTEYGIAVDVYDPWANPLEAEKEYGLALVQDLRQDTYSAVVIAVAHRQFADISIAELRGFCKEKSVIYDVKSLYPRDQVDGCL
jgi:UDP-N-acetyl-D-galactosamine dehydrogenase